MSLMAQEIRARWHRRPFAWPIVLGVVMAALVAALTVGWVLLSVRHALTEREIAGVYWAVLAVGSSFLAMVLVGVGLYLWLSLKAIGLTRRQSNFIDAVTHELKSPIASLKLYLQTLDRHAVTERDRAEFQRIMLENTARLDELIDHLLDAARLDQDERDDRAPEEAVPLIPIIEKTAAATCSRYRVPPETVRLEMEPVVVDGPPLSVEVVLSNLIDNAVKYAAPNPAVTVEARALRRGGIVVRVVDNGRTIPPRFRRRIFGRFVRLGSELQRETAGTGLGLHIVRTLVLRMGGRISVRDRGGMPGNVFAIRLPGRPLAPAPVPPDTAAPALPATHATGAERP